MSNQGSNSAKQIGEAETLELDEPSMDEILASIKKIISDDEEPSAALRDREQYSHPADHSNSNQADLNTAAATEFDLEADLEAAMALELQDIENGQPANNPKISISVDQSAATAVTAPTTPTGQPPQEQELVQAQQQVGEQPSLEQVAATGQTLQDRVEQIRNEVSQASSGLTTEERLEKYRVRGKMKMEALASKAASKQAAPQPAPNAVSPQPSPSPSPSSSTPPVVSPAVAAGPLLPTTHAIAQEMARTMLSEKDQEIQELLSNMMRPSVRKWLSDNLPVLVEKLVREEIERVSRGKKAS
ncbi:MAG: DUF2497 domain-containing protein [Rhizobiaceae bacterium]